MADRPRVVVLGAGFGGLNAARALSRAPVDVVVIDRSNHHLFQPLLYQVATGALAPSDIASPIRTLLARQANAAVLLGEVEGIDTEARTVSLRGSDPVSYDTLIIATGARSSWFGKADWERNSVGLKTLEDADALRLRLLGAFEWAEGRSDPAEVSRLLTFVVVGGGATGVELAGSIRELARNTLPRDFRRIRPEQARVVLFEGGPEVLAGFPAPLARYARRQLERLGVEVRTGTQVERVEAEGVVAGGQSVPSANVFWCAGVAATPAATWLGVQAGRHGVVPVGPDCSLPGHPEVFLIGDVAGFTGADGQPLPGVAPVAKQQARYVARVIAARATGQPLPAPFRYRDQGSLAIVGRAVAVARFPHLTMSGVPAWLIWSGVHLLLLNGLRNRALVYLQWVLAWVLGGRGAMIMETGLAGLRRSQVGRSEVGGTAAQMPGHEHHAAGGVHHDRPGEAGAPAAR